MSKRPIAIPPTLTDDEIEFACVISVARDAMRMDDLLEVVRCSCVDFKASNAASGLFYSRESTEVACHFLASRAL